METARTPQGVAWPDKLITRAEAFDKAAVWPVYATLAPEPSLMVSDPDINLYCGQGIDRGEGIVPCGQSVGQLRRGGTTYNGTLDEMLSAVLRHMVMAHDVPLNTRPRPGPGTVLPGTVSQAYCGGDGPDRRVTDG